MDEYQNDFAAYRAPRPMWGVWGRGHREHAQGFGWQWPRNYGFERPPFHGRMAEEEANFIAMTEEGEDSMFGNPREGRGGPRGRDRQEFGFGRGPDRGERLLEQGDLRWLVLDLIATQPRHGYEIIKAIEEMLDGHYTPSPGVIYPTLTYLDETGLIASEAQATKKRYRLTDEGRAALDANAVELQAAHNRIAAARRRFGGPPAPEMQRAMGNLRVAIQVRLAKGELSPESLAIVTAALDRAASEIERS